MAIEPDDNGDAAGQDDVAPGDGGGTEEPAIDHAAELAAAKARIAELEAAAQADAPIMEAGKAAKIAAVMEKIGASRVTPKMLPAFRVLVTSTATAMGIDIARANTEAIARLQAEVGPLVGPMIQSTATGHPDNSDRVHPFTKIPKRF